MDIGINCNIAAWNSHFGGLKVIACYWDLERDAIFVGVIYEENNKYETSISS